LLTHNNRLVVLIFDENRTIFVLDENILSYLNKNWLRKCDGFSSIPKAHFYYNTFRQAFFKLIKTLPACPADLFARKTLFFHQIITLIRRCQLENSKGCITGFKGIFL